MVTLAIRNASLLLTGVAIGATLVSMIASDLPTWLGLATITAVSIVNVVHYLE